jgi:hypothetical protein
VLKTSKKVSDIGGASGSKHPNKFKSIVHSYIGKLGKILNVEALLGTKFCTVVFPSLMKRQCLDPFNQSLNDPACVSL